MVFQGDGLTRVRARQAKGCVLNAAEMDLRFKDLAGATFSENGEVFRAFRDVFDAVCALPGTIFKPDRDRCRLDTAGRVVEISGQLATPDGANVAQLTRVLDFRIGTSVHAQLIVAEPFRGIGLAALLAAKSLAFYIAVGMRHVELTAGLTTGAYYWAKLGFHFASASDRAGVVQWGTRLNANLATGFDHSTFGDLTPFDWHRLGRRDESTWRSMRAVAQSVPQERETVLRRAEQNALDPDDPVHFGKAVLLTGPSWHGSLEATPANRSTILAYARARGDKAAALGDIAKGL